jgi:subtilisin family serine protease
MLYYVAGRRAWLRPVAARRIIGCLLAIGCAGGFLPSIQAREPSRAQPAGFRTDRIIIRERASVDVAALQRLHAGVANGLGRRLGAGRAPQLVSLRPGVSVAQAVATFQQSGLVEYAEPDYLLQALLSPNDARYQNQDQWNLNNLGQYGGVPGADIMAEQGWDLQHDAPDIIVAVVDSGVRYTHEDLAGNMWVNPGESGLDALGRDKRANGVDDDGNGYVDDVHGINVLDGTGNPMDDWGHGTHVAGIVGAVGNNTLGITGVAWRVKLMACKFITATAQYSVSDAILCLDYARRHGARIVTASWGGYAFTSIALRDAIAALRDQGIILTAAAGNDNNDNDQLPLYPASYDLDNIVAVAATDRTDARAGFSNYGAQSVDLGAPGAPVFSTWVGSNADYQYNSGTSMAAPHIAGACALLWTRYPTETHQQIIQRILTTVDVLPGLIARTRSNGRLNLAAALASGVAPAPPPLPPALAAPTSLSAAPTSSSAIALSWTDNSTTETAFELQRSTDNITFATIGTVGANTTSAIAGGLNPATTYYFRVRALQDAATSAFSNTASATTASAPGKKKPRR